MTIHFYTFSNNQGGSSRQRAFRVAEELAARGISTTIHTPPVLDISRTTWPKKFVLIMEIIRSLGSIKKEDIVYLQRTIANKYFFVIMVIYLFLSRCKMIFDFDDPVYVHSYLKTKMFTRMADAVIVCTHGQATWAQQFNRNVHIFHIAVDFPVYEKYTHDYVHEKEPLTIGWVGTGPEHIPNLRLLIPVFTTLLARKNVAFTFRLIGALRNSEVHQLFNTIPGLTVGFIEELTWTDPEAVPKALQHFSIGVLPHRSEGEWNENKTSLKNLEYMACGVATICSDFGEMPHVITDGINGYLAANETEWIEKLEHLLLDRNLRAKIGKAGQELVHDNYSFSVIIPRLIELINKVAGRTMP